MSALGGAEKKSDKSVENKKGGQLASDTIGTDSAAVQKDSEDLGIGGRADPPNKGDGGNKLSLVGHRTSDFIPWGVRARKILHSIVCGEVPAGYDVGGSGSGGISGSGGSSAHGTLQGGQIKCMVTDMRTSDKTASAQRAIAACECVVCLKQ